MPSKWLGAGPESETPRDGLVSSRAEWHSLLVGASVGVITALAGGKDAAWLFIILAGIAVGGKEVDVGHLEHVSREPVYALVAAVGTFLITAFVLVRRLPGGVV